MDYRTWLKRLKAHGLPNTVDLMKFIDETLQAMGLETYEHAKRLLDWCPMSLKQMAVRYICRSRCKTMPVKETDWWLVKTKIGTTYWHCSACGERSHFSQKG